MRRVLWRASDYETLSGPSAFARRREDAEAYLNNPGFGGSRIFRTVIDVDPDSVLDVRNSSRARQLAALVDATGLRHPGATHADEWVMSDRVADALSTRGYRWLVVLDTFPEGCETWVWLNSGDDPELEAVT